MSNVLNEYYKLNQKIMDDSLVGKCQNFLNSKPNSCFKTLITSSNKKNNFKLLKDKYTNTSDFMIDGNMTKLNKSREKVKNPYNKFFSKITNMKHIVSIRNIDISKLFKNPIHQNKRRQIIKLRNKKNIKDKNISKTFDYFQKIIHNNLRRVQSAKKIESNISIEQKIRKSKRNSIIKELLSRDIGFTYQNKEIHSRNLFPLNKTIDPKKYLEYNLKNEPNNPKLFKSFQMQMKCMFVGNNRKLLVEGVNDYHQNLKKYQEVNPKGVMEKNDNERKLFQRKLGRTFINLKPIDFKNITSIDKFNSLKYNYEKDEFKENYIKIYMSKNLDKELSRNSYIKKNKYFNNINSDEFKKMMSFDDKINLAHSNSQKLLKFMKKNPMKWFKKKYML